MGDYIKCSINHDKRHVRRYKLELISIQYIEGRDY
jgi:hypothetical protein